MGPLDQALVREAALVGLSVPVWSGQSVGPIHDLPSAADVVHTFVREAEAALSAFAQVGSSPATSIRVGK